MRIKNLNLGKILGYCLVALGGACMSYAIFYFINTSKANQHTSVEVYHTRDVYVHRLESKFDAARETLAVEVDKYIKTAAPTSVVDALNLIDLCSEYGVDLRLALVQGHVESHFATKGTAARTYSIFNVGAYDGHSANTQISRGFGYKHPDYSVEPYLQLLVNNYLVDGKTEMDLLNKFVNKEGKRYASSTTYESMLKDRWEKIDEFANITETYEIYKMYKLMLGR